MTIMENQEFYYQELAAERQMKVSEAFPALMRKVYVWKNMLQIFGRRR